ncbi:MAG TPA: MFS transporter [Ignavibacteriales bacterium]|jgi:maltose/moltooligosaccharide transporter|nr:MFS transporter [Ignavibacteriales bacterium]
MREMQKKFTDLFFVILSLPATAIGFALSVQIQCLGWILNTQLGYDLHQIGLVWLAGPLAGILGQVIVGIISDNTWLWGGRRRPYIIIGGIVGGIMLVLLPNLGYIKNAFHLEGTALLIVATIIALVFDLSINVSFNPTRTLITDVTPEGELRTKGYAWMQTISGFFGVLAYLIGAFLGNIQLIYLAILIVPLFTVVPTFFIDEPKELVSQDGNNQASETNLPEFLKICFAHAFTWVGIQTMFIYTFGFIKEVVMGFKITQTLTSAQNDEIGLATGISFAILNTIGFLFPKFVLEPVSRKIGKVWTHKLAVLVMAVAYLVTFLFVKDKISLFVMMAIIGIGWASVVSIIFAIVSEVVNKAKMGLFMGLFNLAVVIPQILSSYLGGWINTFTDKSYIFLISSVTLFISFVIWLFVKNTENK